MDKIVYVGDIIIIKEKQHISIDINRPILEVGYPYFVTSLYDEGFYIEAYGKEILIGNSDSKYFELIEIAERYKFSEGDKVTIQNIEMISAIEYNVFKENTPYTVSKIIEGEIIISNGNKELWIKGMEIRYIKPYEKINKIEVKDTNYDIENEQDLIDKLLDEGNFEKLKELVESKK